MIPGVKEAIEARNERRRVKDEQEAAKRRSDLIDESIRAQKIKQRRERDEVIPVLLVGLPGSGTYPAAVLSQSMTTCNDSRPSRKVDYPET